MGETGLDSHQVDVWMRPLTEELVDVHVYLVPSEKWIENRQLAQRDVIDQAVSAGFVRVLPSNTLQELRGEITEQIGSENVPDTYVFLKSVGRNFTQVKPKQELDLKVKSFIPPYAEEPEIYVKEGDYNLLRSASLGPEHSRMRLPSSRIQTESSLDFLPASAQPSIPDATTEECEKRSQSLDRNEAKTSCMESLKAAASLRPQPQKSSQRKVFVPRKPRPPTPRVTDIPLENNQKQRSKSIASVKTVEIITESPAEQIEAPSTQETLTVNDGDKQIPNSPPPRPTPAPENKDLQIPIPTPTQDTEVQDLPSKLEKLRTERKLKEIKRDNLVQKVKELQRRKSSSKDQAREEWRKRYLEVKRATPRLEDHCSTLRQELEKLVKDMLVSVKTDPDAKPHKPSKKTSHKIMIMRLLQEVEDLRRRLQSVSVKLNAEAKLRAQAEYEVKKLRQELLHKKTQVTLTRKQASFPQTTEQFFISAM